MEINKKSIIKILKRAIKSTFLSMYIVFVVSLIIGGISLGIMTMIPHEASKPCRLGYYALCSFTPFSSLILFAMAIIGMVLLIKLIKRFKKKYKKVKLANQIIETMV